jgi:hypothetical protein
MFLFCIKSQKLFEKIFIARFFDTPHLPNSAGNLIFAFLEKPSQFLQISKPIPSGYNSGMMPAGVVFLS